MKKDGILPVLVLMFAVVACSSSMVFAATDGFYQLSPNTNSSTFWDGTDANRQENMTTDYTYTYGDEASITYTLPTTFGNGSFPFYGQTFSQITTDTNGNIWFGSTGSAHSFNLVKNGRGPVIAVWNDDLSSYYYGGVFIQHKLSPERVVIEWQTETYTNEGLLKPNDFEAVLFPNGNINLDYKSFTSSSTNKDFGSGISLNDGNFAINLTNSQGNAFVLAGQSFTISPAGTLKTLNVSFAGLGIGNVTSNLGVSWATSNATHFPTGTQVTLNANPVNNNSFGGWSGPCSGIGSCTFTLNQDTVVTAQFNGNPAYQVYLPGGNPLYYSTIQNAYNSATNSSVIETWASNYTENLNFNLPIAVTLQGGYDIGYLNQVGTTVIQGSLIISQGNVVINNVEIH